MIFNLPKKLSHWICSLVAVFILQPALVSVVAAEDSAGYRILERWPLAGPGGSGFLLVGETDHRLYISRDTQVTVLDTNNGKTVGVMQGLTDARGIALDPENKFGYIGDGISGSLKIFSVPGLKLISSVNIGGTVDAVVVDPVTHRIFAFDTHNKIAAVVDPVSLKMTGTVKLPGRPAAAVADGDGFVLVNLASTGQLERIDARTLTPRSLSPLGPCVGPSGMTLDSAHSRVFTACENKLLAVSDSRTGELVATVPVGEGARSVGYDPADELVFSANGEGSLSVIKEVNATEFSLIDTVKTDPGARSAVFDPDRGQLYLVSAKFGQHPGPTSEELEFRPTPVPGSSVVLVMKR
jgi:DNA-binding beta-propeller fold protein YncE